jgi:hypothetical protein
MRYVYPDTNVLRYFGIALVNHQLPQELRNGLVLSPISLLELISQASLQDNEQVFAAVGAMRNWLPDPIPMLDLPPFYIRLKIAGNDEGGEDIFKNLSQALNNCLNSPTAASLRQPAAELRILLDNAKDHDARLRHEIVEGMRKSLRAQKRKLTRDELCHGFLETLAKRARVSIEHPGISAFAARVPGLFRHESARLSRALEDPDFNFLSKKRKNDLFDSEQLIYLAEDHLSFLTTDGGFADAKRTSQGHRVHIVTPEALLTLNDAIQTLNDILQAID